MACERKYRVGGFFSQTVAPTVGVMIKRPRADPHAITADSRDLAVFG
jgi:hypothetical protein